MGTLRLTDATASLRSGARDIKSHNLPAIVQPAIREGDLIVRRDLGIVLAHRPFENMAPNVADTVHWPSRPNSLTMLAPAQIAVPMEFLVGTRGRST